MGDYNLQINIDIEKADKNKDQLIKKENQQISIKIPELEAKSIDSCEKIMLQHCYTAIRKSLSDHFSSISKEEANAAKSGVIKKTKQNIE